MAACHCASRLLLSLTVVCGLGSSLQAQQNPGPSETKAVILKHLAISRDFTLKVAEQMPAADYDFKLTPQQLSFGEQMIHLAETFDEFVSPLSGKKLDLGKPASMS